MTTSSSRNGNKPFLIYHRPRQTEDKLKIVHHGLGAADQPLSSARRVLLEQARSKHGHLDQLDCLVETGADHALLRRAGGVPGNELLLRLLQSVLAVGGEQPLQIGQELPDVECRVGQGTAVKVDQR